MEDPSGSGGWRFAQCFGDKGEVEDITEGSSSIYVSRHTLSDGPFAPSSQTFRLISDCVILADIISTVEFDSTGNYLATGDKGGRVVLFERNEMVRLFVFVLFPNATSIPLIHSFAPFVFPHTHTS